MHASGTVPGAPVPGSGYWSVEDQQKFGRGYQKAIDNLEQTERELQASSVRQAHLRSAIENARKAQTLQKEVDEIKIKRQQKQENIKQLNAAADADLQRIIGSALFTMVSTNFAPAQASQEVAKKAAAECTQVIMPFLTTIMNGPLKGAFEVVNEKKCSKLPPEALTEIVVPLIQKCCEKLNKQSLILNLAKFKSELPDLGPFLSGEKRVCEVRIGGLFQDPESVPVNSNTTMDEAQLGRLAKVVVEITKTRPLEVTFAEKELNNRFSALKEELSAKKVPPAVPPKPTKSTVAIPITSPTNAPPHLVPNKGSPPKGQA